jgi:Arc/MetJ-type ribon-helix-helix transcriptional regulator
MIIELKPETEQLVRDELQTGHFHSVDELIVQSVHAWRERFGARSEAASQKSRKHLADVLSGPPFAGSDLNLERQEDYPRHIDL